MRAYTGSPEGMIGPGLYGYVDVAGLVLGEKGGRYLLASATIVQQPKDLEGNPRLPVWSDARDRIVVACPPSIRLQAVPDPGHYDESLVWVDHIERDPSRYRHDLHPMDPRCAVEGTLKRLLKGKTVEFDSVPKSLREEAKTIPFSTGAYGFGSMPTGFIPGALRTDPPWEIRKPERVVALPVFDEKDKTWKQWTVSETSKALQELLASGAVRRTSDGRYFLAPGASLPTLKTP